MASYAKLAEYAPLGVQLLGDDKGNVIQCSDEMAARPDLLGGEISLRTVRAHRGHKVKLPLALGTETVMVDLRDFTWALGGKWAVLSCGYCRPLQTWVATELRFVGEGVGG